MTWHLRFSDKLTELGVLSLVVGHVRRKHTFVLEKTSHSLPICSGSTV